MQRLVLRVGLELRGNFAKPSKSPTALSSARLAAYFSIIFIRLASRAMFDFLSHYLFSFWNMRQTYGFSHRAGF
jgi:hypothetical protein